MRKKTTKISRIEVIAFIMIFVQYKSIKVLFICIYQLLQYVYIHGVRRLKKGEKTTTGLELQSTFLLNRTINDPFHAFKLVYNHFVVCTSSDTY